MTKSDSSLSLKTQYHTILIYCDLQTIALRHQRTIDTRMASGPSTPRASSSSQRHDTSEHLSPTRRQRSQSHSAASSDSMAVLVSPPSSTPPSTSTTPSPKPKINRHFSIPRQPPTDDEPRRCWICFADETEDTPTSTAWRSPCPCALTAHESCLLDWVADLEAPNRKGKRGSKIQCPQCKAEITIARPKSWAVEVVKAAERVAGRLVFPVLTASVLGCVVLGLTVHGVTTVYLLLGKDDFAHLWTSGHRLSSPLGPIAHPPLSLQISLPFIPIILILSRTTIADSLLPMLPIFYLAGRKPSLSRPLSWPPSVGLTLATLPFARAAYNALHKRFILPQQKTWLKEIQPRAGEDMADNQDQVDGEVEDQGDGDGDALVDIELGVEVVVEDDDDGRDQQQEANEPVPPREPVGEEVANRIPGQELLERAENAELQPHPGDQDPAHRDQEERPAPPFVDAGAFPALANRNQNIILSTTRLGDLVVGALLFPAVSAAMGQLIAATFPTTWVVPPGRYARWPYGILQHWWGRTIVGGCAFVVLKDTVLGYSRWRVARDHRRRRIVDYEEKKQKR